VQNRNFDDLLARGERWMEPQARREEEAEGLFLHFYDFEPDGLLTFNLVTLQREKDGAWQQRVATTRLRPWLREELVEALMGAGLTGIAVWGDLQDAPFDRRSSPNLVIAAGKLP
jgi:hypothetical protein